MKNKAPRLFTGRAIENSPHGMSRRDFINRGLATATLSTSIPSILMRSIEANAASTPTCAPQVRAPGAIAQINRSGGNTRSAMFFDNQLANVVTAAIASRYGILGASDLVKVGSNYSMAKSSPYATAIMSAPPGYTQAAWNNVLAKTSLGVIYGPWSADDGAGSNLGLLGGASPWKGSQLGQDVRINNSDALISWGQGSPSIQVRGDGQKTGTAGLTPTSISSLVGLTPANVITGSQLTTSANAAYALSSIFSSALGLSTRTGASLAVNKTYCAFSGSAIVADPNFALSAFNPNNISALTSKIPVSSLTAEEQCLLGSFYASAVGSCGAILIQQNGNDYHDQGGPPVSAAVDFEAGQYLQMFLAACDAAGQPGAFIDVSNGNCSATGTGSATVTVNGSTVTVASPNPKNDSGGSYNAGYIICYHPTTAPVMKSVIGSLNTTSGDVTSSALIGTVPAGMSWLYLTALQFVGADINSAFAQMVASGSVSGSSPGNLTLLG